MLALALLLAMMAACCHARDLARGSTTFASRRQVNADDELDDESEAVAGKSDADAGRVPWPAFVSVAEEDSEEEDDDDKGARVERKEILATPGQIVAFVICGVALVAACLICFAADKVCRVCDALCGHSRKNTNDDDMPVVLSQSPRAAEASSKASPETSASAPASSRHAEPTEVLIDSPIPS